MKRDSFVSIENFERYISLIPNRLAFGRAPQGKPEVQELTEHGRGVTHIVNIRRASEGKYDIFWYKKMTRATTLHLPIELPQSANTKTDFVKDEDILAKARQVVNVLKKDEKAHVFIHGFDAYNYTSVFALVCWALSAPRSGAHFNPVEELKVLYGADIACDFPRYEPHVQQIHRILDTAKRDIFTAFDRGLKRQKHEPEDGAHAGGGDLQGERPESRDGGGGSQCSEPAGSGAGHTN